MRDEGTPRSAKEEVTRSFRDVCGVPPGARPGGGANVAAGRLRDQAVRGETIRTAATSLAQSWLLTAIMDA
ncbi:hypothetical protein GCM10025788_08990 [Serinicoccus chungangensis]